MRIGLLGGTFDPPHYGHLLVASEVLEQCNLDEVWFVPNRLPPHKKGMPVTKKEHRLEMVRLAIEGNPSFRLSTIELEREGQSYTYDTIRQLTVTYRNDRFFFIIGADMINDLPNWHHIDKLVQMTTFIGINRPGYSVESPYRAHIQTIDMPPFDVSSSFLRERFKLGKNTRYYLPERVRNYIEENDLYGSKRSD